MLNVYGAHAQRVQRLESLRMGTARSPSCLSTGHRSQHNWQIRESQLKQSLRRSSMRRRRHLLLQELLVMFQHCPEPAAKH